MTVVGLHPEELLDRESRGELDAEDRQRLFDHLERCAVCRFARGVRADFAAELAEESSVAVRLGPVLPALRARRLRLGGRARSRWTAALLVAAAMLAVTAASASGFVPELRMVVANALRAVGATTGLTVSSPSGVASRAIAAPVAKPASTVGAPETPVSPSDAADSASGVSVVPTAVPAVEARPLVVPQALAISAASLFDQAAAARRRGDYTEAFAIHHELESRFPRSHEAQESHATMGRLLLDRGDAADAVESFDAYLSGGGGGLREETMAGRAEALDRLGRSSDARHAWQDLLDAYPLTSYAEHARARTLGPSTP